MALLYSNQITTNKAAFLLKVQQVADRLGIHPNWLMLVMKMESNLNPQAVNKVNGAAGLIQFITSTAKALGTTKEAIAKMSNVEQMNYVERYFKPYAKYIHSFTDLYLITFYPAALLQQKPDSWNFPKIVYDFNPGLDRNKDGQINLGEFKKFILSKVPTTFPQDELKKKALPGFLP